MLQHEEIIGPVRRSYHFALQWHIVFTSSPFKFSCFKSSLELRCIKSNLFPFEILFFSLFTLLNEANACLDSIMKVKQTFKENHLEIYPNVFFSFFSIDCFV